MRLVQSIYRYPIKGLSGQPLSGVDLLAGQPFPFDRVFALARPNMPIDPDAPRWAKKGLFLMLMMDEGLAQVETVVDVERLELTVWEGARVPSQFAGWGEPRVNDASLTSSNERKPLLVADLKTPLGRAQVEEFFGRGLLKLAGTPKLVHAPEGHFMDKPDNVMSCINLATIRCLEQNWGMRVHPLRFRANFYIEGLKPWEEFDWIDSDITVGEVTFRVDRKNGRCGATNVNPLTALRDMDIPGALRKLNGNKDLGVYLIARTSGKVVVGDSVTVPKEELSSIETTSPGVLVAAPSQPQGSFNVPTLGSYICRGCYYVYVQSRGAGAIPAGTPFAAIPQDFACPDCGTDKASFQPYVGEAP